MSEATDGLAPGGAEGPEGSSGSYKWQVAIVIAGGMLVSGIDNMSPLVALPAIAGEFDVDLPAVQWVALIRLLRISALLLPMGRLSDIVGRKRVAVVGMLVFSAGGALCALAPGLPWLLGARLVQGLGGAAIQVVGPPLLIAAFGARQRGRAMGIRVTGVSSGLMLGPIVGGLVAGAFGWRWVFVAPALVMLPAAVYGLRVLRETEKAPHERFDLSGSVLLAMWMAPLFFLMNRGRIMGWTSGPILLALGITVVALGAFVFQQGRVRHPVLSLGVLRIRPFTVAVVIAVLNFTAFGTSMLLLPFLLQSRMGLAVQTAGLVMATMPAAALVLASSGGMLADRFGTRPVVTTGLALRAGGFAALAFLRQSPDLTAIVVALAVLGVGQAFFQPPNASAMLSAVPRSQTGLASGFLGVSRTFGMASGQAIWGAVFAAVVTATAGVGVALDAPPEAMGHGFKVAFLGCAIGLAVATVLAATLSARGRASAED